MDGKHVNTAIAPQALPRTFIKDTPYKLHCYLKRFTHYLMGYLLANTQPSTTVDADLLTCQRLILHPSNYGVAS